MKSFSTLVLGASPNPSRYAHIAVKRLQEQGHPVQAFGIKPGSIGDVPIQTTREAIQKPLSTVSLYVGPSRQAQYRDWLIELAPERVIFNPGTENPVLANELEAAGIPAVNACTLVMLSVGTY